MVARDLASRGAQLVLLTQQPLTDPFLADYIMDLRTATNNELITAEYVDLSSLYSIRKFATKWVDNAPPRRLDMIILCANTITPGWSKPDVTEDGIDAVYGLNYVANFHLLSILSPALRAQSPGRDVRIIFATCASYMGGALPPSITSDPKSTPKSSKASKSPTVAATTSASTYATSKLALMTFAHAFQKHLSNYTRPDKQPVNARVLIVDPGFTRTPGMRRFLTFGSLWGLLVYLITYPLWYIILKSPEQGAQSFLYAAMEAKFGMGDGGWLIKECRERKLMKEDVIQNEGVQQRLWKETETLISKLEKESAVIRAKKAKKNESRTAEQGSVVETKPSDSTRKSGSRRSRKAA